MLVTGVLIAVAVVSAVALLGNVAIVGTGPRMIRHTPGGQLLPMAINTTLIVLSIVALVSG